ncbi:MAG: YceD family protein [Bacillota bacterium]
MKIDLSILEEVGSVEQVTGKLKLANFEFRQREIKIPGALQLDLEVYRSRNSYVLTGKVTGELILECSRCLEPYKHHLEVQIEKEIDTSEIENIKAFYINPIILNNIILSIPMKPLCSPDCKGLCPECGQNLNQGQCECDTEMVDPRLAKLEDFFEE